MIEKITELIAVVLEESGYMIDADDYGVLIVKDEMADKEIKVSVEEMEDG